MTSGGSTTGGPAGAGAGTGGWGGAAAVGGALLACAVSTVGGTMARGAPGGVQNHSISAGPVCQAQRISTGCSPTASGIAPEVRAPVGLLTTTWPSISTMLGPAEW